MTAMLERLGAPALPGTGGPTSKRQSATPGAMLTGPFEGGGGGLGLSGSRRPLSIGGD